MKVEYGRLLVLVAVTSCTTVLDLDSGRPLPPDELDTDGDTVPDFLDVCPAVPDPAQLDDDGDQQGDVCDPCPAHPPSTDRDEDGVDDACDPCSIGPNVDEDGDGRFDACDLCPTVKEDEQTDFDSDLLSTGCDPSTRFHRRVDFYDLVEVDLAWGVGSQWIHAPGELRPAGASAELHLRDSVPTRLAAVRIAIDVEAVSQVRIELDALRYCELACDRGACSLEWSSPETVPPAPLPVEIGSTTTVVLAAEPRGIQAERSLFTCTVQDTQGALVGAMTGDLLDKAVADVAVFATAGVRVLGVDLVE